MRHQLIWDATDMLIEKGVNTIEINAGTGFGFYYNFYSISELYKNVNISRQLNWHKFHPMANYFVLSSNKEHPGLELVETLTKKAFWGKIKSEVYIFKRKSQFKEPIWI
ncbi:MAG: hypothetical protein ACMUHX_12040 [bacterium]